MKQVYTSLYSVTILLLLVCFSHRSQAQCSNGQPNGQTAYDTTIRLGSGVISTDMKFPKFDPATGMVTCVRLCVTIKGIIDTIAMENYTNGPQTGSYTYTRKDTITGPGIPTFLSSTATINSPTFPLAANNGVFFSGPDFYSQGPDTILTRMLCSNISDSATIAQFYGVNDSVTYSYTVNANLNDQVTGGSAFKFVLSSALVNFRFEYCTCPAEALPLNIKDFSAERIADDKAELKWSGYDDPYSNYHYEVQVSRNGINFSTIGSAVKGDAANNDYRMTYAAMGQRGTFYFRIKQVYANGAVQYSNIKLVDLKNSDFPGFTLYPNPSNGIVGIKFDNTNTGRYNFQIYNSQGQMMLNKDIVTDGASLVQLGTLKSGAYWVRMTDVSTRATSVNQLLIK